MKNMIVNDKEKKILLNKELSLKEKGFLILLLTMQDSKESISIENIKNFICDGKSCLYSVIKKLKDLNIIKSENLRDESGRFYYTEYTINI